MTLKEFRMSQRERMIAIARTTGIPLQVLGAVLVINRFLMQLTSKGRTAGAVRRETPMQLAEFRRTQKRRTFTAARNSIIAGLLLATLLAISSGLALP